uniref:Uncharacterized protein n=1 Tax=Glossina austeni TaxID=7395 RepID=A0A1A9VQ72_GLOAU
MLSLDEVEGMSLPELYKNSLFRRASARADKWKGELTCKRGKARKSKTLTWKFAMALKSISGDSSKKIPHQTFNSSKLFVNKTSINKFIKMIITLVANPLLIIVKQITVKFVTYWYFECTLTRYFLVAFASFLRSASTYCRNSSEYPKEKIIFYLKCTDHSLCKSSHRPICDSLTDDRKVHAQERLQIAAKGQERHIRREFEYLSHCSD